MQALTLAWQLTESTLAGFGGLLVFCLIVGAIRAQRRRHRSPATTPVDRKHAPTCICNGCLGLTSAITEGNPITYEQS